MYLIISLITILILVLYVVFYKREGFQSEAISPSQDLTKMAKLYNIQYSANIPGVDSQDIYETPNKCLKYEANMSCSSNERAQFNDLDCKQTITANMNGVCKCTKSNIPLPCDSSREPATCDQLCENAIPPKSLEFNGKDSRVDMELAYTNENGFTMTFYVKLNEFKRYPYKPQLVFVAKNEEGKNQFIVYINENRKVCVYSFNNKLNYIDNTNLDTNNWFSVSFGNQKNNQFIQINDKRKTFTGMNLDQSIDSTRLVLHFGSDEQLMAGKQYLPFKGLLGNITIYQKYMDEIEICQNNKYCGKVNMEASIGTKCMYVPEGSSVVSCIRKCKDDMRNNQCNIEQCMERCENCEDMEKCPFKKPPTFLSNVSQPEQEEVENPEKCEFKPWGINESHCVSECSEGVNRDKYGGALCNKEACARICHNCENIRYCPWLLKDRQQASVARSPNAPRNLVGLPANNSALLMWSRPNSNNSEIIAYKVLYYKANYPQDGIKMYHITRDKIRSPLKYNLMGLDNGVTYNIGVVAVNAKGASKLSNLVTVKPQIIEGFTSSNEEEFFKIPVTENFHPHEEEENKCNLFNQLRGKQINISI